MTAGSRPRAGRERGIAVPSGNCRLTAASTLMSRLSSSAPRHGRLARRVAPHAREPLGEPTRGRPPVPRLVTKDIVVTSCENQGETDLILEATAEPFALKVDADGSGTITYAGGDEQDGVDVTGTVSSIVVSDAGDFTVEGTGDSGESFTWQEAARADR